MCRCSPECVCVLQRVRLLEPRNAMKELGLSEHHIRFTSNVTVDAPGSAAAVSDKIYQLFQKSVLTILLLLFLCSDRYLLRSINLFAAENRDVR